MAVALVVLVIVQAFVCLPNVMRFGGSFGENGVLWTLKKILVGCQLAFAGVLVGARRSVLRGELNEKALFLWDGLQKLVGRG